ncbi:MAG TPA: TonB-dependent receptor, partial [Prevotella sp.]|nr:TonB-dependent receptor [Prevotella sp.]
MLFARNNNIQRVKLAKDSILIKSKEKIESKSNRNVMLNASDNTSPRDINIGLPTTLGGISILENDLPVVYYFWPDLPNRSWRQ